MTEPTAGTYPAGWYKDPLGRYTFRYYDGTQWTEHASSRGLNYVDQMTVVEEKKGVLQSLKPTPEFLARFTPNPDVLAKGTVDDFTTVAIYKDGTFTTKAWAFGLGSESPRDRLLSFDHDLDSMRRKSMSARGAAALMTSGVSLLGSNNRGVVYVTVTGEQTGVRTFTKKNPTGVTLTSIRSLKAAADSVLGQASAPHAVATDVPAQLKQLADLHAAGALSVAEFTAAKAGLLG